MAEQPSGLRWLGTHTIIGVPARDLSPEEAARHAGSIAAAEKAHGFPLYAPVQKEPAKDAPSKERKE